MGFAKTRSQLVETDIENTVFESTFKFLVKTSFNFPDSCCKSHAKGCGVSAAADQSKIYTTGCKTEIIKIVEENTDYEVYGGLGFGFLQIILIIAALQSAKRWDGSIQMPMPKLTTTR